MILKELCCCCFQTFKDLMVFFTTLFDWGCKGKSLYDFTKFIFNYFENFCVIFILKNSVFYKRAANIERCFYSANFISKKEEKFYRLFKERCF